MMLNMQLYLQLLCFPVLACDCDPNRIYDYPLTRRQYATNLMYVWTVTVAFQSLNPTHNAQFVASALRLTLSVPHFFLIVAKISLPKRSAPYWSKSNTLLIFLTSARVPECQKLKRVD